MPNNNSAKSGLPYGKIALRVSLAGVGITLLTLVIGIGLIVSQGSKADKERFDDACWWGLTGFKPAAIEQDLITRNRRPDEYAGEMVAENPYSIEEEPTGVKEQRIIVRDEMRKVLSSVPPHTIRFTVNPTMVRGAWDITPSTQFAGQRMSVTAEYPHSPERANVLYVDLPVTTLKTQQGTVVWAVSGPCGEAKYTAKRDGKFVAVQNEWRMKDGNHDRKRVFYTFYEIVGHSRSK